MVLQVDTVHNMFPDIPTSVIFICTVTYSNYANRDNIRYDLLRTGNVEQTVNKVIEKGFLDAVCLIFFRRIFRWLIYPPE
jgi:coupling of ubiquitin conjugation to ER degradation protein 1